MMQKMCLMVLCILLCTGTILQLESCKYKVAILRKENITCFRKQKQETACEHPNCRTESYNGMTCIKWFDADLTCVDTEVNKVPIENHTCAQDQESLDCTREFLRSRTVAPTVVSKASAVNTNCGGAFILLLVIIIVFCLMDAV